MKSKSFNLKIGAIFVALALIAGIAAIPKVAASANSAQEEWYGSSTSGMLVTDENCPVVVESETLTFDINTFPNIYYYGQEDFEDYDASVTAHYNFYNPADYDVNMTLAFPFGDYPTYLGEHLDESGKYSVTADGQKIESSVRHTLSYGVFNAEKDVAKILNDYKDDEFFKYDTPVHYYTYSFTDVRGENMLYLNSVYDKEKTAIFYATQNYDGLAPYAIYPCKNSENPLTTVTEGTVLYLFVVGDDFESAPQLSYGMSWPLFGNNTVTGEELSPEKEITFKDLMLAYRSPNSEVSEIDWYNAAMDYMDFYGFLHYTMKNSLMRWFEYQLAVPAGGRIQNEVTAPMYPDIYEDYSPNLYRYEYLLSPAKCWASFGTLDITVNTPYYLSDSSLGKFEKVEGGYTMHLNKLPDGELNFTLCESKHHTRPGAFFDADDVPVLKGFVIVLSVIFGIQIIAAIPLIIVFAVKGMFSSKPKEKKL